MRMRMRGMRINIQYTCFVFQTLALALEFSRFLYLYLHWLGQALSFGVWRLALTLVLCDVVTDNLQLTYNWHLKSKIK